MTSAALAMAAPARHAVMAPITTTSGCLRFRLIVWRGAKTPLAGMSNGKRAYMSSRKRHSSAFTSDDSIPDSTESLSAQFDILAACPLRKTPQASRGIWRAGLAPQPVMGSD